jgi:hypothetical protein
MKLDSTKYPFLIPSLVISIMLFLAIPNLFPYSYYWGVRWMVTAGSIYFFYQSFKNKCSVLLLIFALIGILFNPVFPVHLDKVYWITIDLLTGIIFLISNLFIINKKVKG